MTYTWPNFYIVRAWNRPACVTTNALAVYVTEGDALAARNRVASANPCGHYDVIGPEEIRAAGDRYRSLDGQPID